MERKSPIRILIVDDEPELRIVLAQMLELSGFETESVASAEEAMEVLTHKKFDALVTDVSMPGGSGYDLLDLAKFVAGEMPVIMISGNEPFEELSEKGQGAFHCLPKPLDSKQLLEVLNQAVGEAA